jgi:hypothetical protein
VALQHRGAAAFGSPPARRAICRRGWRIAFLSTSAVAPHGPRTVSIGRELSKAARCGIFTADPGFGMFPRQGKSVRLSLSSRFQDLRGPGSESKGFEKEGP